MSLRPHAATAAALLLSACGASDEAAPLGPPPVQPSATCRIAAEPHVVREDLVAGERAANAQRLLRFVQTSDEHIMDEDGQAVSGAGPVDPLLPQFEAAMRFQDEYSDEVMNRMVDTINGCHALDAIELVVATGDNTDLSTVSELRRFIDNLDGTFDRPSRFEMNCAAATPAALVDLSCTRFTGRGVADTQTPAPDADSLLLQPVGTRMVLQAAATEAAVASGRAADGSTDLARSTLTRAAGLPQSLRCEAGTPGCASLRLAVPYYVAFGNHDGTIRGVLAPEPGVSEEMYAAGRRYLVQQHDFIDEFFETSAQPGPVGHGFNHVEAARLADGDGRNDGWYAFDAGAGRVRMVVLNTLVDGTDPRIPAPLRNPFALSDGMVDEAQFAWLQAELAAAAARGQLVLVFSHHADLTFVEYGLFGALAPQSVAAAAIDAELASWPNVVAWIAGHTHLHRIRAFRVEDGVGSNGLISVPVACRGPGACEGFWQIESASLIDFPQEARLLEVYDNGDGTGTIVGSVLQHDFALSQRLAEKDDQCQLYLADPETAESLLSDAGLGTLCAQGGTRDGEPADRNVELMFRMP